MSTQESQAGRTGAAPDALRAGREALERHAWEDARRAFEAALATAETPDALEGLASALPWLDDVAGAITARQRAFRLYQERGDARSAARVATRLGVEFAAHRAEFAVADGWFQRARRLLAPVAPGPEHAWLALWEAGVALHFRGDTARGRALAAEGAAIGRDLGLHDAQIAAVGLEGLRLVDEGRIGEGMKLLDEAATAALTGELPDLEAGGYACCYVLTTCERVRDFDRAMQWLDRVVAHHTQIRTGRLLAYCRSHLLGVLIWRGEWARAEEEIASARADAERYASSALALDTRVREAELRRLQGRPQEAAELLRQGEGHPAVNLGWAALALDQGDHARAIDHVHRHFRASTDEDRLPRATGEILLARAHAARGETAEAAEAVARLRSLAEEAATRAMTAELRACEGSLASAEGNLEDARRALEDAVDLFAQARNPYETARTRLALAEALDAADRAAHAREEAARAAEAFRALGARAAEERAVRLLSRLRGGEPVPAPDTGGLSPRQLDVLRLLARGLSNREIGAQLFVSEFTVKRHVADILGRLDLPTRAAAAAWAVERRLT
jgi:DNA-binding NarL/FixJ family response regulator